MCTVFLISMLITNESPKFLLKQKTNIRLSDATTNSLAHASGPLSDVIAHNSRISKLPSRHGLVGSMLAY